MRLRLLPLLAGVVSLSLLAGSAEAQTGKAKGKKREAEKVEMKDVPAAVLEAAKKEVPNASFTSAEKQTQKKTGNLYTLEGKDGKYQISVMMTSTGELQRLVKAVERRRKKADK